MAQPMLCDAHGAPGVMLMNTLIPPVESMVFCEECLPAQIILIAGGLGILDEVAAVAVAEERERVKAEKPEPAAKRAVKRSEVTMEDSIAILAGEPDAPTLVED